MARAARPHRERPAVALAPGAVGPWKRWPAAYADVARRLTAQGIAVWVLGGPDEKPLATQIIAGCRPAGPRSDRHRPARRDPGAGGSRRGGLERLRAAARRGGAGHTGGRHIRADQPVALGAPESDRRGGAARDAARLPAVPQADLPHKAIIAACARFRPNRCCRPAARARRLPNRPLARIRSTAARTSSSEGISRDRRRFRSVPPERTMLAGLGADENRDQRHAERGGKMQQAGVHPDHEGGMRNHPRDRSSG